jgi:hypothetical protein
MMGRRWQRRGAATSVTAIAAAGEDLAYDSRLDEEIDRLEES